MLQTYDKKVAKFPFLLRYTILCTKSLKELEFCPRSPGGDNPSFFYNIYKIIIKLPALCTTLQGIEDWTGMETFAKEPK